MVPPMSTTSRCSSMRSMTGCGRARVELPGVGAGEAGHVAGVVDDHDLQAEAQPEAGDVVLPGVAGGRDLALDAPLAEAAGDDDPVEVARGGRRPAGPRPPRPGSSRGRPWRRGRSPPWRRASTTDR